MPLPCDICGVQHIPDDLSFAADEPDPISQLFREERSRRVSTDSDFAILDEEVFFVRGLIVVPVHEYSPLLFGIWANLHSDHFSLMKQVRADGSPNAASFHLPARLTNTFACYPSLLNRRVRAIPQRDGRRPEFILVDSDHPLYGHQREGISLVLAASLAAKVVHSDSFRAGKEDDKGR
jgi:hypothetical protein